MGLATAQLLESLVGSWISIFMQRRRALSTLDVVYDALRGRAPTYILQLSPMLKAELISWVILCPLCVADLRAAPACTRVVAVLG